MSLSVIAVFEGMAQCEADTEGPPYDEDCYGSIDYDPEMFKSEKAAFAVLADRLRERGWHVEGDGSLTVCPPCALRLGLPATPTTLTVAESGSL